MHVKEAFVQVKQIQGRFQLTSEQMSRLYSAKQIDNILMAAAISRWDQVTLMLIQENVIDKWPS